MYPNPNLLHKTKHIMLILLTKPFYTFQVWYLENHYNGEPMFVPRPGAEKEDDGIVLVTNLNGDTKQSYLLMLDGETFEPIAQANLPERIPMSIHGYWSSDIL